MQPALYGRDTERAALRQLYEETLTRGGRLVFISGAAGIGKTALVRDFRQFAEHSGAMVLIGRSYEGSELSPYWPWIETLQQYDSGNHSLEIPEQLRNGVDLEDIRSQPALFERARDLFGTLSDQCPLVIVLEDAHWIDQASLDALRYLARWLARKRILFIVTFRDSQPDETLPLVPQLPDLVQSLEPVRMELRTLLRPSAGRSSR